MAALHGAELRPRLNERVCERRCREAEPIDQVVCPGASLDVRKTRRRGGRRLVCQRSRQRVRKQVRDERDSVRPREKCWLFCGELEDGVELQMLNARAPKEFLARERREHPLLDGGGSPVTIMERRAEERTSAVEQSVVASPCVDPDAI